LTDLLLRNLTIEPQTFDADARTFDAVISTGADVRRRDGKGPFVERLDLSNISTDLVGLPVLDGHRQEGSEHAVGSIVGARREASGIVATVRLSAAEDVRSIATKVAEGVLRGVSIGYSAEHRSETVAQGQRVVTIRPRIHELSVVAIPADPWPLSERKPKCPNPLKIGRRRPTTITSSSTARRCAPSPAAPVSLPNGQTNRLTLVPRSWPFAPLHSRL
jgi:HK97 family phage prohead protease